MQNHIEIGRFRYCEKTLAVDPNWEEDQTIRAREERVFGDAGVWDEEIRGFQLEREDESAEIKGTETRERVRNVDGFIL